MQRNVLRMNCDYPTLVEDSVADEARRGMCSLVTLQKSCVQPAGVQRLSEVACLRAKNAHSVHHSAVLTFSYMHGSNTHTRI